MGASNSRSEGSQHTFAADTPMRFSENIAKSLQSSTDSDSIRAKNIELQIQTRVNAELQKLLESSSRNLDSAAEAASDEPLTVEGGKQHESQQPLRDRLAEKLFGSEQKDDSNTERKDLDRVSVSREVEQLRQKLSRRKQTIEMDKDVANAKDEMVKCLRLNDRRPLDCWEQVEKFKSEVGRLEKNFVDSQTA